MIQSKDILKSVGIQENIALKGFQGRKEKIQSTRGRKSPEAVFSKVTQQWK